MRILVVGATGTIGRAVAAALLERHEVIGASRTGERNVDLRNADSIERLLSQVGPLDAVVSVAGSAAYKPLDELTPADFQSSFDDKLMGQISLARAAVPYLRDNGSITLTSGWWSVEPIRGVAAIAMVNAALEGFTRAAALELPRGVRLNVVSPPLVGTPQWVDGRPLRMTAEDVAKGYVEAIEGAATGRVIDTRPYARWLVAA